MGEEVKGEYRVGDYVSHTSDITTIFAIIIPSL